MARPDQIRLTIELDSSSSTSRITVRYRANFTDTDVTTNRQIQETIQLFGEDPPAGAVGDQLRFTFPTMTISSNGQTNRIFTRTAEVANSVLNEDPAGQEDEIYALVCLQVLPLDPEGQRFCRPSLVVSQ